MSLTNQQQLTGSDLKQPLEPKQNNSHHDESWVNSQLTPSYSRPTWVCEEDQDEGKKITSEEALLQCVCVMKTLARQESA